ncbi:MAG: peroxiredoxin family protein [candidate division NC10 bacterium]|nr:peroxiredoxin family protein [candidate division NC10 bacterium]
MCQTQLGKLQRRLKEVEATGAAVFAVSIDRPEVARKLRQDLTLSYPILSDPRMEVTRAYRMKGERMEMSDMGYVIIDRQGLIRARRIDRTFADNLKDVLNILGQVRAAS